MLPMCPGRLGGFGLWWNCQKEQRWAETGLKPSKIGSLWMKITPSSRKLAKVLGGLESPIT